MSTLSEDSVTSIISNKESKILIVCHGNICRSPIAQSVIKSLGYKKVISRGIGARFGTRVPKRVRTIASSLGYNVDQHRSVCLNEMSVETCDILIYMDLANRNKLGEKGWLDKAVSIGGPCWVHDPNFMKGLELHLQIKEIVEKTKDFIGRYAR